VIVKLEKSDDLLFKSELRSARKAKVELQYLRRKYDKANKLEAIRMKNRMVEIENKYFYLEKLQELKQEKT
jgi:hypothetical protein